MSHRRRWLRVKRTSPREPKMPALTGVPIGKNAKLAPRFNRHCGGCRCGKQRLFRVTSLARAVVGYFIGTYNSVSSPTEEAGQGATERNVEERAAGGTRHPWKFGLCTSQLLRNKILHPARKGRVHVRRSFA